MHSYRPRLKHTARTLRKNLTDAEVILWSRLKNKQLYETTFNRQKPLGPYIVDFYTFAAQLVIELDGGQHFETPEAVEADRLRDEYLRSLGIEVLRFNNHEVFSNLEGVLGTIYECLVRKIPAKKEEVAAQPNGHCAVDKAQRPRDQSGFPT